MPSLDVTFRQMRQQALTQPLTRAAAPVLPEAALPGGTLIALSLNK
jgi:hypothetical protein